MPDAPEGSVTEAPEVGADGGEDNDITPPAATEWWKFDNQADAEKWSNDLVTKRLSRHKKSNVDPLVAERDTLRAEVEQLRPLKEATQTDTERWESKFNAQSEELNQLKQFRSQTERTNLVRQVADEEGLPASFIGRVSGDDEDTIREDVKSVLNALSEGGFNTGKKTPLQKNPKADAKGGSVSSGGGSDSDEPDDDALSKSIVEAANKKRGWGLGAGSR